MAYVLSSVSGNLISAASAGYAPTNSADVSAIASAYQIVSSTATQLYAGTAYVTSVNDAPISASRAGNAANASLATSAYYDGTGRLISALPDNAAVSAIASSYAESAASSKLDSSASSSFYPANNPSGFISSVDLSDYATTAYVDSSISGFAYNSAVSGWTAKQDALTFGYDTADKISGINGSALAGEGGGLVTAIGTSESGIASINNSGLVDTAALHSADYSSLYVQEPLYISASGDSSYIGISGNVDGVDSATCSAIASAYAESAASSKLDTTAASSFATTAYVDSSVSSKLDATASSQFLTAIPSDYATTAYVDSSISGFAYESAVSAWTAKQDALTYGYDTANNISSIDGSAIGGQGGIDSATCSSIASAYADSAVSAASSNYYPATSNPSGYLTAQAQASWSESASASPSYIQDKPDLVDIVAGPGIVIDNPDGNTLRVSVAQAEEVVLWDNYTFANNKAASVAMTETPFNFSQVRITFYIDENNASWGTMQTQLIDMTALASNTNKDFTLNGTVVNGADLIVRASRCRFSGTSIVVSSSRQWYSGGDGAMTNALHVYRIVGIHRIANN